MSAIFKNTEISLYTTEDNIQSHTINIILNEKNIKANFIFLYKDNLPENFLEINNYGVIPTLVDRDIVIYNENIIAQYLDERFPHPPLLPIEPKIRTEIRLLMYRLQNDWIKLAEIILSSKDNDRIKKARHLLSNQIISRSPICGEKEFFANENFSILDCTIIPILRRLPALGIELPQNKASDILEYMQRMFNRESVSLVHERISLNENNGLSFD